MNITLKDRGVRDWPSPPQIQKVGQILLDYDNLRDLGITYSKEHLRRLETAGQFPNRVRLDHFSDERNRRSTFYAWPHHALPRFHNFNAVGSIDY